MTTKYDAMEVGGTVMVRRWVNDPDTDAEYTVRRFLLGSERAAFPAMVSSAGFDFDRKRGDMVPLK